MKKTGKCPGCNQKLKDFRIDLDNSKIQCANCKAEFIPTEVWRDSEIVVMSTILPPENRESFLINLGFEKKTKKRTSKFTLYFAIVFFIVMSGFLSLFFYIEGKSLFRVGVQIVITIMLPWMIIQYYKDEAKPKWKRLK